MLRSCRDGDVISLRRVIRAQIRPAEVPLPELFNVTVAVPPAEIDWHGSRRPSIHFACPTPKAQDAELPGARASEPERARPCDIRRIGQRTPWQKGSFVRATPVVEPG